MRKLAFIRLIFSPPGSLLRLSSMRQSREIGVADVEVFLSMLANERKVSASTHNQAHRNFLSAARLMRRALLIKLRIAAFLIA
jgi:hypothetical protein